MRLILLGAPGAGKGTQAHRLKDRLAIPHISTGHLFRAQLKEGTALGKTADEYIGRGELVPDTLVVDMVDERLKDRDALEGCILDGFPRTLGQAEALDASGLTIDHVVEIDVDSELLVGRLTGRLTCRDCGRMYHRTFDPPATDACGDCSGELFTRADDAEETVRNRLSVYVSQTEPLLGHYHAAGLLRRVEGTGGPDAVETRILAVLGD